jgi:predicted RNase H-like HicB family nuclease
MKIRTGRIPLHECPNIFEQVGFSRKEAARLDSVVMARKTDARLKRRISTRVSGIPAIVHNELRSFYGVSLPDFPGCVSAGKTLAEARRNAAVALKLHMQGMAEDADHG